METAHASELDRRARELYIRENRFTDPRHRWPNFDTVSDKEKDYWRALIVRSDEIRKVQQGA